MKICIVTNIPVPYRIPIFNIINSILGKNFLVIYAARKEPNRLWDLGNLDFNHIFLEENIEEKQDGFNYVHNNKDILKHLISFSPDYIITTGFNPTHLYAYLYSKIFFKKHIYWSDGTIFTEKNLTWKHELLRKIIFNTTYSFLGPSNDNKKLYMSYGINENKIFKTHLCVDNNRFDNSMSFTDRKYDLIFSGQFIDIKQPIFFLNIVEEISFKKKLNILIIGDGPLKEEIITKLNKITNITYNYPGFVSQEELPYYYSMSRIFLFTTKLDAWGVVANESLASGTPVIVTPYAGVANDLVKDNVNGFVLDINKELWSEKIIEILDNETLWENLSKKAKLSVSDYTFKNAAEGILNSCHISLKGE